jgi:hypothetical protein
MITYWRIDTQWTRLNEDNYQVVHLVNTDSSWFIYSRTLTAEEATSMKAMLTNGAESISSAQWEPVLEIAQTNAANL